MPKIISTLLTASLFLPGSVYAAGNPQAGETKAYTCTGCHGVPGYNNVYPTYKVPKIGGQNYEYLVIALKAYRNAERHHSTMELQAQALSDQDIEDVAAVVCWSTASCASSVMAVFMNILSRSAASAEASVPVVVRGAWWSRPRT